MKTCKTGCGKMKAGGSIKKMAKGGQALNKAKGFAPAQKGGDNVKMGIYGMSNAGTTGPNRTGTYDYKKGGAIKKHQNGGPTIAESIKQDRREIMRTPSGKIGIIGSALGSAAIGAKMIADKIKSKKAEKKSTEEKKKKETTKAKFGASVNVQRGYPGKIRSAGDQGYTAVGNREPERTKFQKGGSTYLGGPSGGLTPGTIAMRADKEARSKYFTPDNIRKEGIKLSDKDIEKKVKVATDSLYKKYMKDAKLTPEKKSTTKKSGAKKMATGGSLKPVNKSANPGLAKLPTAVRNKMGYQKKGGSVKK
jgi:hypothetical protein